MTRRTEPQFPLYIPSKGRAEASPTSKALTRMGVPHYIVVEPQQVDEYRRARAGSLATILEMDLSYKDRYELCDDLGHSKSTGAGPARNFLWEHSIANGHEWHWTMDDNIKDFRRLHRHSKIKVSDGTIFRAMEDFTLRYTNVGMAGPNYAMFAFASKRVKPITINTRIYSCNLIRNDIPFRWRGRYNEDTILSLDMLKKGWCTILFNAFLQGKMRTMTLSGGNTDEIYQDGTVEKSAMQVRVHPDVSKMAWRYGRCHHRVDYTPFQRNRLIRREGFEIQDEPDDYGMSLKKKAE